MLAKYRDHVEEELEMQPEKPYTGHTDVSQVPTSHQRQDHNGGLSSCQVSSKA